MQKKKILKIVLPIIAVVLVIAIGIFGLFFNQIFWETEWFIGKSQTADLKLTINEDVKGAEFEGFGASACWWSQIAGDNENAEEIVKLLYSKEGLGLNIYRYNIGGGSADNPDCTIGNEWRRTESFYYFNEETGEYEYDFTRDANAQRILDLALSYGCVDTVVLFANSPHYSMTLNGKANGNEEWWVSNITPEHYEEYVDYFLTITEYFLDKGVPVKYISPINEPNWSWGQGGNAGQEGCFYNSEDIYAIYKIFAREIKERNLPVLLSGPESGEFGHRLYEWADYILKDPEISECLGEIAYHSYWSDDNVQNKMGFGKWITENVPESKMVSMTEWCHLPCTTPIDSIDSALIEARVMANDLEFTNINSWTAWVGVNEPGIDEQGKNYSDGLLVATDKEISDIIIPMRYYAVAHFSQFIPTGSVKIETKKNINDLEEIVEKDENGNDVVKKYKYITNTVSYLTPDGKIVTVIVNEGCERKVDFKVDRESMTVYTTTQNSQLEVTYAGKTEEFTMPEKSIMTIVFE